MWWIGLKGRALVHKTVLDKGIKFNFCVWELKLGYTLKITKYAILFPYLKILPNMSVLKLYNFIFFIKEKNPYVLNVKLNGNILLNKITK